MVIGTLTLTPSQFKKWHSCSPLDLYDAPVIKFVFEVSPLAFTFPWIGVSLRFHVFL